VSITDAWRALHRSRFAALPLDCGNKLDPGVIYSEDLRDWSDKATTPDQARMERYVDRYDLRGARILHVGVGNSGFARRFHRRVGEIVGTTIDPPEIEVARALSLPNYRAVIHNKYSGDDAVIDGQYDFILDNNPTSPCCCFRHLSDMFDLYVKKLAPGGQIVTDRVGLRWIPADANWRWSFDFDDLDAVAGALGLRGFQMTGSVYVLSQAAPPKPDLLSRVRQLARQIAALPGRIVRSGRHRLARVLSGRRAN
jgi:hypothetical protein